MDVESAAFHPPEVALDAIGRLSDRDLVLLRRFARAARLIFKQPELLEDDLINESIVRTLDGERGWNKKLDIVQHLCGAMRSIASDQVRLKRSELECVTSSLPEDYDLEEAYDPDDPDDPANLLINQDAIVKTFNLFSDDEGATAVLIGLRDGYGRPEAMVQAGLSEKDFCAAEKRVARKLLKLQMGNLL